MPEYKLNFTDDFYGLVKNIKHKTPATDDSDVLRRAISLYSYLHQEVAKVQDGKVAILDKEKNVVLIIDPLP